MPRRRLALVLAPALALGLAACQPKPGVPPVGSPTTTTPPTTSAAPTTTTTTAPAAEDLGAVASGSGATAYYVDCAGNDAGTGRTAASAWKTITKANKATLAPGDVLMLKRGCTWEGTRLEAAWNGTATKPIKIGTYGTGALPRLRNGNAINVRITGSYQVVQDLDLSFDVQTRAACGQPIGDTYDVTFSLSAHHNTIQRMTITSAMTGVLITPAAHANKVLDSTISGNDVMKTWGGDPELVLGAWGVLINSDDNEVARNVFRDNNAVCASVGDRHPGNSVEIYEGSRNQIHHNRSYDDRVFSELGGSAARHAADNVFAYNLFASTAAESAFIITRGALDTRYGPVYRTVVTHNTTYQTAAKSLGVVCGSGCNTSILTLTGNVVWAEEKALYGDDVFTEHHNLFWSSDGTPFVQLEKVSGTTVTKLPLAATSKLANPLFAGAGTSNFRLKPTSPAIDAGGPLSLVGAITTSLGGVALPQGLATDAGAYEYTAP